MNFGEEISGPTLATILETNTPHNADGMPYFLSLLQLMATAHIDPRLSVAIENSPMAGQLQRMSEINAEYTKLSEDFYIALRELRETLDPSLIVPPEADEPRYEEPEVRGVPRMAMAVARRTRAR